MSLTRITAIAVGLLAAITIVSAQTPKAQTPKAPAPNNYTICTSLTHHAKRICSCPNITVAKYRGAIPRKLLLKSSDR